MLRRLAFLAPSLFVSACFYPADRGRLLEERVDTLMAENRKLSDRLKETQDKQASSLEKVEKALDGLDKAARRSDADVGVALQKTIEDLAGVKGQIETVTYRVSELEGSQKKLSEDVEKKTAEDPRALEAKKKAEEFKGPADPKEFVKVMQEKSKAGDNAMVRALGTEFFKKWPTHAAAADVHVLLGDSYTLENRCREALYEYGKVIQEFAKASVAPVAYLASAECFEKLKMKDEARMALEELQKTYPRSDAAKVVPAKLKELGKAAPGKKGAR